MAPLRWGLFVYKKAPHTRSLVDLSIAEFCFLARLLGVLLSCEFAFLIHTMQIAYHDILSHASYPSNDRTTASALFTSCEYSLITISPANPTCAQ